MAKTTVPPGGGVGRNGERGLVRNRTVRRFLQKEAMSRRATVLPDTPLEIYVDPCTACNLRCTFCPQSDWGQRKRGMMQWELFERVLSEVVELRPRRVYLFCYGESLLASSTWFAHGRG